MDESVNKGLKLLSLKGSDAAIPKSCDIGRILVKGYDTGLPHDDVEIALRKHFASCGEITDVYIPIYYKKDNTLWKCAYIYFLGEGAVNKALQLNGSDVGGWKVSVTAYPFPPHADDYASLIVEGYDPSLSDDEIKSALIKIFSSYGKINKVLIFSNGSALVDLYGEDAAVKAPQLSGSKIGGREVIVRAVGGLGKSTVHRRRRRGGPYCGRNCHIGLGKKAKTTAE